MRHTHQHQSFPLYKIIRILLPKLSRTICGKRSGSLNWIYLTSGLIHCNLTVGDDVLVENAGLTLGDTWPTRFHRYCFCSKIPWRIFWIQIPNFNTNGISTSSVRSLWWDRLWHADPSGLSTVEWRETGWCSSELGCQLTLHKHWLQPVPFSDYDTPSTYFTVSVGLEPGHGLTGPCALGSTLRLQTRCQPGYSHSRLSWRKSTSRLKCLLAELSSLGPSRMKAGVPLWCLAGGSSLGSLPQWPL